VRHLLTFCEARADFLTSACLIERTIRESAPPWQRDHLDAFINDERAWIGAGDEQEFVRWKRVERVKSELGVRPPLGHFKREPARINAAAARTALAIARHLRRTGLTVDAVILVRDMDDQPDRREGLRQARSEAAGLDPAMAVVVGAADPEREAWVLAGFDPESGAEHQILATIRAEVGLDPRLRASELTAKHDHDKKSSKRILRRLTQDDPERQQRCLREASLSTLQERGGCSGLSDFLTEIAERIVPLFGA
jgi:hypothetical protein